MIRSVLVFTVSICIVVVSWVYQDRVQELRLDSSSQARHLMVKRQHAEQRLARLKDGLSRPLLSALGEDVSAVQIRIAEYLTDSKFALDDRALKYEQSLLPHRLSTDAIDTITSSTVPAVQVLRLDVQLRLAHAQEFLSFIEDIKSEVAGWPLEVRACDLQKTPVQNLDARCVMDIYHWSAIGNE
ncbi:MAG: hypothetical protein AB8B97_16555 [Granulosicoccus sp.]